MTGICARAAACVKPKPSAVPVPAEWTVYRHAKLVAGRYHDGDSFHLSTTSGDRIFRLYYVDAPETDEEFPERVAGQAKAFGVSPDRIPSLGRRATEFTEEFLRGECTVYTRMEDAEGRSRAPRVFAFVEANGRWLHEALVEAGLARVYGKSSDLPDGTAARVHWHRLDALEAAARKARAGAWAQAPAR